MRIQVKLCNVKSLIFIIVLCLSTPILSADQDPAKKENGSFHIYFENDTFMSTDRGFTHGFRFSWYSNDKYNKKPGFQNYISLSIGQNIYTPENLKLTQLDEQDRPYAGYLYLG